MNFIYISPDFPQTNWQFCNRLSQNGVNVLGIGEAAYDSLSPLLKSSLTEYYRVASLENYDEVMRAVAFLTFKHGKIDWLESNNEHWMTNDARLRTDFNISSGFKTGDIENVKSKSKMKNVFAEAGLVTARLEILTTEKAARKFIKKVGYPVVIKPDIGVGAANTTKIKSDEELQTWFSNNTLQETMVIEEYVPGEVVTYDAIIDDLSKPLFEASLECPYSIMDIVNDCTDSVFFTTNAVIPGVKPLGRKLAKAFNIRSRFIHLEFFRLLEDKESLGKKGDFIALEVNMRPGGGYIPDMHNYSQSTDVYRIWAEMIVKNQPKTKVSGEKYWVVSAGLRNNISHLHSHADIIEKFGDAILSITDLPDILATAMGNKVYMAKFTTKKQLTEFIKYVTTINDK